MVLKTLHFVQGLQNTFIIFSSISHHQISQNDFAQNKISRIENLKTLVLWPMRGLDRDQFGTRSGWGWDPMGGDPWEPKGIPWEGTPWEGDPWEPKGSHGRGPRPPHGGGTPWEGTLGAPHWEPSNSLGGARIFANSSGRQDFG